MLAERLGDHVGGAGEDRLELGVVGGRHRLPATLVPSSRCTSGSASASAASKSTTGGSASKSTSTSSHGVLGDVADVGDDDGDRVADEPDVAVGEHADTACRPAGPSTSTQSRWTRRVEVGGGEHGDDAVEGAAPRRRRVDVMWPRATSLRTNAACSMPGTATSST